VSDSHQAVELILSAVKDAKLEGRFGIALDVAASEFFVKENGNYDLGFKETKRKLVSVDQLCDLFADLHKNYNVISIEDPFDQDDFAA